MSENERIIEILKKDRNSDKCVVCGEIVPEGMQVCNNCFVKFWTSSETDLS
jgi:NMD protein affecting ribosome stability and mRNA decay